MRDDAPPAVVLPEDDVEDEPHARQHQQDDDPRDGLERIAILEQDDEHQTEHGDGVKPDERQAEGGM